MGCCAAREELVKEVSWIRTERSVAKNCINWFGRNQRPDASVYLRDLDLRKRLEDGKTRANLAMREPSDGGKCGKHIYSKGQTVSADCDR
jgi:hypothetical protein